MIRLSRVFNSCAAASLSLTVLSAASMLVAQEATHVISADVYVTDGGFISAAPGLAFFPGHRITFEVGEKTIEVNTEWHRHSWCNGINLFGCWWGKQHRWHPIPNHVSSRKYGISVAVTNQSNCADSDFTGLLKVRHGVEEPEPHRLDPNRFRFKEPFHVCAATEDDYSRDDKIEKVHRTSCNDTRRGKCSNGFLTLSISVDASERLEAFYNYLSTPRTLDEIVAENVIDPLTKNYIQSDPARATDFADRIVAHARHNFPLPQGRRDFNELLQYAFDFSPQAVFATTEIAKSLLDAGQYQEVIGTLLPRMESLRKEVARLRNGSDQSLYAKRLNDLALAQRNLSYAFQKRYAGVVGPDIVLGQQYLGDAIKTLRKAVRVRTQTDYLKILRQNLRHLVFEHANLLRRVRTTNGLKTALQNLNGLIGDLEKVREGLPVHVDHSAEAVLVTEVASAEKVNNTGTTIIARPPSAGVAALYDLDEEGQAVAAFRDGSLGVYRRDSGALPSQRFDAASYHVQAARLAEPLVIFQMGNDDHIWVSNNKDTGKVRPLPVLSKTVERWSADLVHEAVVMNYKHDGQNTRLEPYFYSIDAGEIKEGKLNFDIVNIRDLQEYEINAMGNVRDKIGESVTVPLGSKQSCSVSTGTEEKVVTYAVHPEAELALIVMEGVQGQGRLIKVYLKDKGAEDTREDCHQDNLGGSFELSAGVRPALAFSRHGQFALLVKDPATVTAIRVDGEGTNDKVGRVDLQLPARLAEADYYVRFSLDRYAWILPANGARTFSLIDFQSVPAASTWKEQLSLYGGFLPSAASGRWIPEVSVSEDGVHNYYLNSGEQEANARLVSLPAAFDTGERQFSDETVRFILPDRIPLAGLQLVGEVNPTMVVRRLRSGREAVVNLNGKGMTRSELVEPDTILTRNGEVLFSSLNPNPLRSPSLFVVSENVFLHSVLGNRKGEPSLVRVYQVERRQGSDPLVRKKGECMLPKRGVWSPLNVVEGTVRLSSTNVMDDRNHLLHRRGNFVINDTISFLGPNNRKIARIKADGEAIECPDGKVDWPEGAENVLVSPSGTHGIWLVKRAGAGGYDLVAGSTANSNDRKTLAENLHGNVAVDAVQRGAAVLLAYTTNRIGDTGNGGVRLLREKNGAGYVDATSECALCGSLAPEAVWHLPGSTTFAASTAPVKLIAANSTLSAAVGLALDDDQESILKVGSIGMQGTRLENLQNSVPVALTDSHLVAHDGVDKMFVSPLPKANRVGR